MLAEPKLAKVTSSIKKEGAFHYIRRIAYGGIYRQQLHKHFYRSRLALNPIKLFGYEFFLSHRPLGLTEELQLYGIHEPLASETYRSLLKRGEIILDIGSNVGYYALLASANTENKAVVHCFEPDPELIAILEKNRANGGLSWELSKMAVSESDGEIPFYRSQVANWGGIREKDVSAKTTPIQVRSTTLDGYCSTNNLAPTFLRMDIEGAEVEAMRGAGEILRTFKPKIFMELHLSFLSAEEKLELIETLSQPDYQNCLVIKRYYDSPWAIKQDMKFIRTEIKLDQILQFGKKRDEGVLSLFLW
jgi:FkbM family methyltransferase